MIKKIKSIAYITHNGKIPSRTANSVGVMNMCSQYANQSIKTYLIIPDGLGMNLKNLGNSSDIWDFYSVKKNFQVKYIKQPAIYNKGIKVYWITLLMILYTVFKRISLITTRNIEVAYLAAIFKKRVILESHNYAKFSNYKLLDKWIKLMNNSRYQVSMVVTTYAGKKSYVERGIPENKILVESNGVALERFETQYSKEELRKLLKLPLSQQIIGFSGSLYEGRGIEQIIESAEKLKDLFFLIVGGSPEEVEKYKNISNKKELKNIKYVGHVSQTMVPQYLLASDILLIPYTTISAHDYMSPMKIFDYLATGLPIVATDFTIVREILKNKINSVLVEPDSGTSLTDGIKYILNNPVLSEKIARKSKEEAIYYSWENRAKRILEWQNKLWNK